MSWQVIGHDWAVQLLSRSLAIGRLSHAYLFTGPPQVGKTTMGLALAQALNCSETNAPCNRCPSCRKIVEGVHPDVRLVVGQGASGRIQIDQIRALQRETVLAPYEGRYRVSILRGMDHATTEAANSLLKTLEEPPSHLVLALTAVHVETLPPTVVSRCQRFNLRPVDRKVIQAALIERGTAASQAHLLAQLSGGRLGWALEACQNATLLQERQEDLTQLLELMAADRVDRFDFAWNASRDPAIALRKLELWSTVWRDLLLVHGTKEHHVVNVDWLSTLRSLAQRVSPYEAWATLEALRRTVSYLEANVNVRLALESMMLKLPGRNPNISFRVGV